MFRSTVSSDTAPDGSGHTDPLQVSSVCKASMSVTCGNWPGFSKCPGPVCWLGPDSPPTPTHSNITSIPRKLAEHPSLPPDLKKATLAYGCMSRS